MPDQALISPVRSQRRGENAMTTAFELLRQKLPAFGPLAAAMYEKSMTSLVQVLESSSDCPLRSYLSSSNHRKGAEYRMSIRTLVGNPLFPVPRVRINPVDLFSGLTPCNDVADYPHGLFH